MKHLKISAFEFGSFFWILVALFALFLAITGIFHLWLLVCWLVLIIGMSIIFFKKKLLLLEKMNRVDVYVLATIVVAGIALSFFTTPTIFGGRDEGSLATAGILLSKDHSLEHSAPVVNEFFKIYGQGKALNFPGFYYTTDGSLRSQFLPGLPSWIGIFTGLFGIQGLKLINFLPFVTFLFSFYLIAKNFSNSKFSPLLGTFFLASTLPLTLFFKFTLSEIYFGSLIWFSLYLLLKYLKSRSQPDFIILFLPLLLIPFVRIESIGFILALFFLLILFDHKHICLPRYQLFFVILGLALATSIMVNSRFFVDTVKNFATISPIESIQKKDVSPISIIPDDWKNWYMLKIFHTYNLIPLFIMATAVIVRFLRKKKWFRLVPFFFFAPTLIYVADANISLDHPWMLRRFTFAIIPLLVLYSVIFLEIVFSKFPRLSYGIVAILFALNLSLSLPLLTQSQNKTLLAQTAGFSKQFGHDDLILVSRKASGNGWSLLSEPLHTVFGLQAVYFFNPNDYAKLDHSKFNNIFLITSNEELAHYSELEKEFVQNYSIDNSVVQQSRDPLAKPEMKSCHVDGKIFKLNKMTAISQ